MISLEEMHSRLVTLGEAWADKDAAASAFEESRRSIRAQIAMRCMGEAKSIAKAELMAEADDEYKAHVRAMVSARRTANIAKVNFDAAKIWVDMWRSQESTRRAELSTLKG